MSKEKSISMKIVKQRTGLSSRQIRYYDEMGLIFPERSPGNQRLFSEEDIDRLNKIKSLLDEGYNVSSIKKKLTQPEPVEASESEQDFSLDFEHIQRNKKEQLTSLYPVSNRSYLAKVLRKKEN